MLPKVRRARVALREHDILGKVASVVMKTLSMDEGDRALAADRRAHERSKQDYRELRIKEERNYQQLL